MTTPSLVTSLAGDLAIFLAAAGLLALVLLRPSLLPSSALARSAISAGATLLAAGAVLHGTAVEADYDLHGIAALRALGVVLLVAGTFGIHESRTRQAFLGALLIYGAGEATLAFGGRTAGDAVRALGGLAIGVAILLAARRSLAARIGATAGIVLVTLVLILSSALSYVLTTNVDRAARQRAEARAGTEAGFLEREGAQAGQQARTLAQLLGEQPATLAAFQAADQATRTDQLNKLNDKYLKLGFIIIVNLQRQVVAATKTIDDIQLKSLVGSEVATAALTNPGASAGALHEVAQALFAVGAAPIESRDSRGVSSTQGVLIAGNRFSNQTLLGRTAQEPGVELTLDVAGRIAASTLGRPPPTAADLFARSGARRIVDSAEQQDTPASGQGRFRGARGFLAAAPIHDTPGSQGRPVRAALIVSEPSTAVAETRQSLFRTLFLVALGAGLAALALALALGERIGRPLLRLARAAESIRGGDLGVRTEIRSADEIGVLGTAFDDMAGSVQRMTSELADAAAQREAILASMSDGLVATDPAGRVTMINPAAEALLDVRAANVRGVMVADLVRGADRAGTSFAERLAEPAAQPWAVAGFLADTELPVALSGAPIHDDHATLAGSVYLLRDMRREFEVERMKTEFLSNISHELRTPLTPIKGYAEMLRLRRVPPGRARIFLDGILDASERLERIIDILVNFAALEAGRFVLRTEAVDVREVLHQMSERWRSRSPNHDVEEKVSTRIPRVVADRRLLERSIDELIDNAVKYSPDGGRVTLRAKAATNGSGRVIQISVVDEGVGIEAGDVTRIFEEFQQLDGSATRRFGGLGLGLPFVARVVQAHHGHVDVESQPGRGSVFTLNLPVEGPTRVR